MDERVVRMQSFVYWAVACLFLSSCTESTNSNCNNVADFELSNEDTIRREELQKRWNQSRYQSPDSMFIVANAMIALAKETHNSDASIEGQMMLASYYSRVGASGKAIAILEECLAQYPSDVNEFAPIYNNLGNAYIKIGDFDKALAVHLKGLKIVESEKDTIRQAIAMLNIGGVYSHLGDIEKSLELSNRAFDLANTHGIQNVKMQSAFQIADLYVKQKNDSLAAKYADTVISVATLLNTDFGINKGRSIKSKVAMNQGRLSDALELIQQIKSYYKENGNVEQVVLQSITEASILDQLGEADKAEQTLQEIITVALERNQKEELWQLFSLLAKVQEQQGKTRLSYAINLVVKYSCIIM